MIKNYIKDPSYFISPNSFTLNYIQIGPFTNKKNLGVQIQDFLSTDFKSLLKTFTRQEMIHKDGKDFYFFILV